MASPAPSLPTGRLGLTADDGRALVYREFLRVIEVAREAQATLPPTTAFGAGVRDATAEISAFLAQRLAACEGRA
jgi:hypothetical protein